MATAVHSAKAQRRLNLFDMPELMPGAQPSAYPAQREQFEQRCRQLHDDMVAEEEQTAEIKISANGGRVTIIDLEAMFPSLDTALVRALAVEAPTPQHAIETLLALSAATAEPVAGGARAASSPPRDLRVECLSKFPSLCDNDGWQVVSSRQLERDPDEDLGSAWRDRAKAAKDIVAPRAAQATWDTSYGAPGRRRKGSQKEAGELVQGKPELETDYEFRQRMGQRREANRAKYGRGTGRGRGAALQASGRGADSRGDDDESVSDDGGDD